MGPNNTSDSNEPHTATLPTLENGGGQSPRFNASYLLPNEPAIATCSRGAQSLPLVISDRLTIDFPAAPDLPSSLWYTLTFVQTFHYLFPSDFGTWQIDNLSTPGGPGGGWAFSYSPCS